MRPNPHIALIYHYDLARALAGEVVEWVAIPVNVDAGREGGDLCRAAADFGKRRDLFAMPAPSKETPCSDTIAPTLTDSPTLKGSTPSSATTATVPPNTSTSPATTKSKPSKSTANCTTSSSSPNSDLFAVPAPPVAVEQPAVDPEPDTASTPVPASAANRERLRARIAGLVAEHPEAAAKLRTWFPDATPSLKRDGHTVEQLEGILRAVRLVESSVGAPWHPDDDPPPSTRPAIARALAAWADRDPGTAWFAASLIATFEQCRNADSTFEDLVSQFTIEQADRLHDAAQGITP